MLAAVGGSVGLTLGMAFLASIGVKLFTRSLLYSKAFLISLASFFVGTCFFFAYTVVRVYSIGLPYSSGVDSVFMFAMLFGSGTLITKLAHRYGIEKTGFIGIGAKAVFTLRTRSSARSGHAVASRSSAIHLTFTDALPNVRPKS